MAARKEILALGEGLQILEDARKAGMQLAGKLLDKGRTEKSEHLKNKQWSISDADLKTKMLEAFLKFKDAKGKSKEFQEKAALKYFLDGFTEAYEEI